MITAGEGNNFTGSRHYSSIYTTPQHLNCTQELLYMNTSWFYSEAHIIVTDSLPRFVPHMWISWNLEAALNWFVRPDFKYQGRTRKTKDDREGWGRIRRFHQEKMAHTQTVGFVQSLWVCFSIEQNPLLHSEDFVITGHKICFDIFKYLLEMITGEVLPSKPEYNVSFLEDTCR